MKLQYRITVFIFAILLAIGVVGGGIMLYFQRQDTISHFEESALALAFGFRGVLEHDMLQGRHDTVQESTFHIASTPLINEVVVLTSTQKVYASSKADELGQTRNDDEIARVIISGEMVTRTEEQYGRSELCVILPVRSRSECYGCHGYGEKILGVIEIGLNRSSLDSQVRVQTLIMMLIGGGTFISVGAVLSLVLRSTVVNPLAKLAASTRRIAAGDFSARADVERKDEVGMVAQAFNEMAGRVGQHARGLEDSKKELEDEVLKRTQQIQQMAAFRGQLLKRLMSAQEEERRRIAQGLHDEAGQALTTVLMELAAAIDALPDNAAEAREKLSLAHTQATQSLTDLRKMIYDLRPEVLDQLGLVPALRSYAKNRLEPRNIQTKLQFRGALKGRLSFQVENTLFRIIQEAMTNIIRHSKATMVDIQMVATNSEVTATVEDNGNGFDVEAALQSQESWGLRGMRERAAVVGGHLTITSEAGKGTRLEMTIPLKGVK